MGYSQPGAPGSGDRFDNNENRGRLLLIYPKSFQVGIQTTKGVSDVADVDIIVVDNPNPDGSPRAFFGARLFGNLARSVSREVPSGVVLGRLNQVTSANGNTPWILENYTPQDEAMTDPYDAAYRAGQIRPQQNPMGGAPAAPPQQQYQQQPPQQQYGGAPAAAPAQQQYQQQYQAPPPQQYQAPPATPAPGPAPQQQWQGNPAAPAPGGPPAAPVPAQAPAGADPALLARLAQHGINLPPNTPQAQAEAVAATLPQ